MSTGEENRGAEDDSISTPENQKVFEELTLEERKIHLAKLSYFNYFQVGAWIDAQDTVGSWCMAKILKVLNYNIFIHFDGWAGRYDEVMLV